ncbi:hypothetical protein NFI96_000744 [Prochilodus magdalenae]|nr:hypothetical protein NFI96_000744 [Prochilodus magdalenae]
MCVWVYKPWECPAIIPLRKEAGSVSQRSGVIEPRTETKDPVEMLVEAGRRVLISTVSPRPTWAERPSLEACPVVCLAMMATDTSET